jgi:phosphatidylserine/phosphatidylglycerophosphate/cardiolipin synthase-like enzyme
VEPLRERGEVVLTHLSLRLFLELKGVQSVRAFQPSGSISLRALVTETLQGSYAENLVNGEVVLPRLLQDLKEATKTITITMFLFFNDPIGQEVANIVIAKASDPTRPVKVRVLLNVGKTHLSDPFSNGEKEMMQEDPGFPGDALDIAGLVAKLRAGNVEVHDTNIDYDKIVTTNIPQFDIDEADIRHTVSIDTLHVDHRKIVTIDGSIGYCGSANIGAQYLYHVPFDPHQDAKAEAKAAINNHRPEPWWKYHDGLVRFAGPVVADFEQVFRERWVLDGGQDFQPSPVSFAPDGTPGHAVGTAQAMTCQPSGKPNQIRELFQQLIAGARSSIFIENPYLYHPQIVDALINAKTQRPGLRVDLVLPSPSVNDSALSADAQQYRYQRYIPAGINVYEYQNHFNHLKLATFDDAYAIVGSANLNYRSLEDDKDFEMIIHFQDAGFAQELNARVRDVDIANSRQIQKSDVEGPGSSIWDINTRNPITIAAEEAREL